MLSWLVSKVRDWRIALAFRGYEARCRAAQLEAVARTYSTVALELERERRLAASRKEAGLRFDPAIHATRCAIAGLEQDFAGHAEKLRLLDRSYENELGSRYEEHKDCCAQRQDLQRLKRQSHADLDNARSNIDAWHRKSKGTILGNGGKKLPQHALFGQSFGDLNGYKYDRERAAKEIGRCKDGIAALSARIDELNEQIQAIKADRQRMRDILQQGCRADGLRTALRRIEGEIKAQRTQLAVQEQAKKAFLTAAWQSSGAAALQDEINQVTAAKARLMAKFDSPAALQARRQEHRQQWLRQRAAGG